jgi:hypothetical protein
MKDKLIVAFAIIIGLSATAWSLGFLLGWWQ